MMKRLLLTAGSIVLMTAATAGQATAADPENTIKMETSTGGTVTIELMPETAPEHAKRIKALAREGFYDGIKFHRVIDGFMAQTGDPTGTGTGGSNYPDLPAEFTDYTYKRGTVGMARTSDPNSANSQFFICFNDTGCKGLTGQYTVVGQVTEGMEYIDQVAKGEPPAQPDTIVKMTVASDMNAESAGNAEPAAGGETEKDETMGEAMKEKASEMGETMKEKAAEMGEAMEEKSAE